jgi:hypothetical protein
MSAPTRGIVLNAPKSAPLHLAAGDEVVVVTRSRSVTAPASLA